MEVVFPVGDGAAAADDDDDDDDDDEDVDEISFNQLNACVVVCRPTVHR